MCSEWGLCSILKIQDFSIIEGQSLQAKLNPEKGSLNDHLPKQLYSLKKPLHGLLGNGQENKIESIPEGVDKLLLRNYDCLYHFDGKGKPLQIFIPENYLTKAVRYVDPSIGQQNHEKIIDAARKSISEEEKKFFQKEEKINNGMRRSHQGTVDHFLAKM